MNPQRPATNSTRQRTLTRTGLFLGIILVILGIWPALAATQTHTVYLPVTMYNDPPPASIFGVEINRGRVARVESRLSELRPGWVRYNGFLWSEVKSDPGEYNWNALQALVEPELRIIAKHTHSIIAVIRGTPDWAQSVPGSACGPIKPENLGNFAAFVRELVVRYSQPPFNISHWEIWNEPDVDPRLVPGTSPYGCWGNLDQPYYGGEYYAEMLKDVYPAIKSADPDAQVVLGGLLLDCDPENPPPGQACRPGHFLAGVLNNGGGDFFDIAAYHGYAIWPPEETDWDLTQPGWKHRGGATLGKLDYVRTIMQRYGVSKPIMLNEAALLCFGSEATCTSPPFEAGQANYAIRMYTRARAENLLSAVWYPLNYSTWRYTSLLDADQQPRPAFQTLVFMRERFAGATYARQLAAGTGLEGHEFQAGSTTYQIYWTNDASEAVLHLPPNTQAVYNAVGARQPIGASTLTVGFEPRIIEIRP